VQFTNQFDLTRLAPKRETKPGPATMKPWYVEQRQAS
jgi:hypothetical protein